MPERRKFRVYLAGPISGCNEKQTRHWRDTVKRRYGAKMTFLDPLENLAGPEASKYEVVKSDLQRIEQADGLLVNMWQESIGAAMGVVHAHQQGKLVVVSDPNHMEHRMLAFFADAVGRTLEQAAKMLLDLLQAESGWQVVKSGGRPESFRRRKIIEAVRAACREAKRDDVSIPGLVLPIVIERLRASDRRMRKSVTTTDVRKAVADVLEQFGRDAAYAEAFAGVGDAWRSRTGRNAVRTSVDRVREEARDPMPEAQVPISCGSKPHATIWGKTVRRIEDIPSKPARDIFRSISAVRYVTSITLGQFGHKEKRSTCQAIVFQESPTPYVIEGKLHDRGDKGTVQSFHVRVQSDSVKKEVTEAIERALRKEGRWSG